jgi:hypothetical protein
MQSVLYGYEGVPGRPVYRIGQRDWFSIAGEATPPGDQMVLRLGYPDPKTGQASQLDAHLAGNPDLQAAWVDVTPATPALPAMVVPAGPPGPDAASVPVSTPDGRSTAVRVAGNGPRVARDDPILGLDGTAEGAALLRDFPAVQAAMRTAAQAGDGLARAVRLGYDGVAFAGADRVVVAPADHPWTEQALLAIDPAHPGVAPLFRINGKEALSVDTGGLSLSGTARRMSLGQFMDSADPSRAIYVDKDLRPLFVTDKGAIVPDALARKRQVVVREASSAGTASPGAASQPDVRIHEGSEWFRVTGVFGGSGGAGGPGSAGGPGGPGTVPLSRQLVLVCPVARGSNNQDVNCDHGNARTP